jgi:hypothetical protein
MEQMNTEGLALVNIDYDSPDTPESVKNTHPILYLQDPGYCCLLGPDPNSGIAGRGKTPKEAMTAYDRQYQDRLEHPIEGDAVSAFILQRHI